MREPKGDWYEAWLALTMRGVPSLTWRGPRGRLAALKCLTLGHREVIEIPHREICEMYWHGESSKHQTETANVIERVCRHCDSGYLKARIAP